MSCTSCLTALVIVTAVACWTEPFNWHFLPKHYRLYSNHTVDHIDRFDTDCGTQAADSGATHFLWDPEGGLCSLSYGLTAADFSVTAGQDSKTSFYYVRDFTLVVPPGSPNCPTETQLKRMIDNLLSLNMSFAVDPHPYRRTWRDECKKNEHAYATPTKTTTSSASPTNFGATITNASSVISPDTTTDSSSSRPAPSTVNIVLATKDSPATSAATSTKSTTLSGATPTVPPAMTDTTKEEDSITTPSRATTTSSTVAKPVSTIVAETMSTSSTSKAQADAMSSSSSTVSLSRHATAARDTTPNIDSDTTAYKSTSASSLSGTHSSNTSSSDPATNFTSFVTTAWETTAKSDPKSTLPTEKLSPVTAAPASSTSSVPESTQTSLNTTTTIATTSAIPPSAATIETTGIVETTVQNGEMSKVASKASSSVKNPSSTKLTPTKRTTPKQPTAKGPTPKRTTPKPTTTKGTKPKPTTTKRTIKIDCQAKIAAVPFYQAYSDKDYDYIYTRNFTEANKTRGYMYDGITGHILPTQALGSSPLYRLYHEGSQVHFYTMFEQGRTDAIHNGYKEQGVAGYVYEASKTTPICPCPEVQPLYRLIKKAATEKSFYTMDTAEKKRAVDKRWYRYMEIAACIYPI